MKCYTSTTRQSCPNWGTKQASVWRDWRNPENDRDLVVGHRLKPAASQLQVCIFTILLTTFICITKKCQMQYLLLCNQQWSEVIFPSTADTKLLYKRTSVCQHPVHIYSGVKHLLWNKFCTCSMTHSTSYALVKRRNYWMQISCIPIYNYYLSTQDISSNKLTDSKGKMPHRITNSIADI